jgi:hypothetical protein
MKNTKYLLYCVGMQILYERKTLEKSYLNTRVRVIYDKIARR